MDLLFTKSMELKAENDASDKKSLLHIAVDLLFKRSHGQEPHNNPTIRKHVKIIRSLLRSGYPMYTLNFFKHTAINLLLEKNWNVSNDIVCKVVKAHIE